MRYFPQTIRSSLQSVWKTTSRKLFKLLLVFLPGSKKITAERWFRGREQVNRLSNCDVAIVSFGKSGRTWLRVMLSRVYQQMYALPSRTLIASDNFHRMNPAVPSMFFTHDNYVKDYTGNLDSKADYYDKDVVLLARDPRDVAVSQFFQWKHRMKPGKKKLNKYPEHGADVSLYDFLIDEDAGLPHIIEFMNLWLREAGKVKSFFLLRYEDLRLTPEETLRGLLTFMETPASDAVVADAVEYSSYENMKKLEQKKTFWLSGGKMKPRDSTNPNSFKVRRAKVGGYRDYLDDKQIATIEKMVNDTLAEEYGYRQQDS